MIATVRHLTKDHILITPDAGYSVVMLKGAGGALEAFVVADDGTETIRLRVEPPALGRELKVKVGENKSVEIEYQDKTVDGY